MSFTETAIVLICSFGAFFLSLVSIILNVVNLKLHKINQEIWKEHIK